MPLCTVTCDHAYYPPDDLASETTPDHDVVITMVDDLPAYMIQHRDGLHIGPDTPIEGVQVDIQRFHARARNAPNIWLRVEFTEAVTEEQRLEARNRLGTYLRMWADRSDAIVGSGFRWALDVFFAGCPGHGMISDSTGMGIEHQW